MLAHAMAVDSGRESALKEGAVQGPVVPMVGRETRQDDRFGAHVSSARFCYIPGSRVEVEQHVCMGHYGIWESG